MTSDIDTSFTFSKASGPVSLKVYYETFSLSVTDSSHLITMPQISGVSLVPPPNGTNANGSYFGWSGTISTGVPATAGPYSTVATSSSSYTDAALLALLTGSGTTPLSVSTLTDSFLSWHINSGGSLSQATYAGLDATITYEYTPVPVPGAFLLFAPGLLGLAALRRRVKK